MNKLFALIVAMNCCFSLSGSYKLVKVHEIPSKATTNNGYRPVEWSGDGARLFTAWGENGTQLGVIDTQTWSISTFQGGDLPIISIAYKEASSFGFMTIGANIGPTGGTPSEVRLWDINKQESTILVSGKCVFQQALSGPEDMWVAVLMQPGRMLGQTGSLYIFDSKTLVSIIAIPEGPKNSFRPVQCAACIPGSNQWAMAMWYINESAVDSTLLGYVGDPFAQGSFLDLKADFPTQEGQANIFLNSLTYQNGTLLGWADHSKGLRNSCPCLVEWSQMNAPARVIDFEQLSDSNSTALDANNEYVICTTSYPNKLILLDRNSLDTVLCVEDVGVSPKGLAFNPAKPNQFAVGIFEGVSIYEIVRS